MTIPVIVFVIWSVLCSLAGGLAADSNHEHESRSGTPTVEVDQQ